MRQRLCAALLAIPLVSAGIVTGGGAFADAAPSRVPIGWNDWSAKTRYPKGATSENCACVVWTFDSARQGGAGTLDDGFLRLEGVVDQTPEAGNSSSVQLSGGTVSFSSVPAGLGLQMSSRATIDASLGGSIAWTADLVDTATGKVAASLGSAQSVAGGGSWSSLSLPLPAAGISVGTEYRVVIRVTATGVVAPGSLTIDFDDVSVGAVSTGLITPDSSAGAEPAPYETPGAEAPAPDLGDGTPSDYETPGAEAPDPYGTTTGQTSTGQTTTGGTTTTSTGQTTTTGSTTSTGETTTGSETTTSTGQATAGGETASSTGVTSAEGEATSSTGQTTTGEVSTSTGQTGQATAGGETASSTGQTTTGAIASTGQVTTTGEITTTGGTAISSTSDTTYSGQQPAPREWIYPQEPALREFNSGPAGWRGSQEQSLLCFIRGLTCPKWDQQYVPDGGPKGKGDGFVRHHGLSLAVAPCTAQAGVSKWDSPTFTYNSPGATAWRVAFDVKQSFLLAGDGHGSFAVEIIDDNDNIVTTAYTPTPTLPTDRWRTLSEEFDGSKLQNGKQYRISLRMVALHAESAASLGDIDFDNVAVTASAVPGRLVKKSTPSLLRLSSLTDNLKLADAFDKIGAFAVVDKTTQQFFGWMIQREVIPSARPDKLLEYLSEGGYAGLLKSATKFVTNRLPGMVSELLEPGSINGVVTSQVRNVKQALELKDLLDIDMKWSVENLQAQLKGLTKLG